MFIKSDFALAAGRTGTALGRHERDHGPLYRETRIDRFPVEPWATASNLIFLLLALYWARRIRRHWRSHPIVVAAIPILLLGWIGGTIYHATRSHPAWLVLDWMSIALLLWMAGMVFWRRLTGYQGLAVALSGLPFFLSALVISRSLPLHWRITFNYALMDLALTLPAVWHCARRYPGGWRWLAGASAAFAAALLFRQWDRTAPDFLPMGTHFLWHLFGGVAAFCVFGYLVTDTERTMFLRDVTPPRVRNTLQIPVPAPSSARVNPACKTSASYVGHGLG